ncbi:hypothetical protein SBOR_7693 [Sclerotinia borealis F-4128]|uniref:Uncharacterized protein n=1 Tax=Sclerotinia borealis (strain F-4128) TaxID=1432307 RepID=W9CAK7_SCLBF|nr:hypothetical protein SBOR_7693 [Sclerotinia borealis F-4128]
MPDDYSSTGGGLKLKGASTGAGITKKKKKKKNIATTTTSSSTAGSETVLQKALKDEDTLETTSLGEDGRNIDGEDEVMGLNEEQLTELDPRDQSGKTASERAHEEMRRRRLNDRLKREGTGEAGLCEFDNRMHCSGPYDSSLIESAMVRNEIEKKACGNDE